MRISAGIIFIWAGTVATIPAGWVRDTDFDSKYLKGTANATNPNTTGGTATHSHTSPAHTHTAGAHVHTIYFGTESSATSATGTSGSGSRTGHDHSDFASGAVASFSCSSVAGTYSSISNDPLYYSPIFITPSADIENGLLPIGVICLSDKQQKKLSVCNGTNGTPNLVGKFLKGAGTGANAGGTGGSITNIHNLTHTHSTSHNHAAATSGNNTTACNQQSGTTPNQLINTHTHSVTPDANVLSTSETPALTTAETVEPAHTKLLAYQAKKIISLQPATIAMWKGTLANIPRGWILCDGTGGTVDMRGRHLKITATLAEVGATDGSNTHTHAAQGHTHTRNHGHIVPNAAHTGGTRTNGTGTTATLPSAVHAVTTNNADLVLSSANTTADSANNEPEYRTVAFIKSVNRLSGPAMFQLFVH